MIGVFVTVMVRLMICLTHMGFESGLVVAERGESYILLLFCSTDDQPKLVDACVVIEA